MPTSAARAKGRLKNFVTSPISASLENLIYSYRDSCLEQRLVGLSFQGVWCVCAFYEFKLPQSSLSDEGKWYLTSLVSLQYFCLSEQPTVIKVGAFVPMLLSAILLVFPWSLLLWASILSSLCLLCIVWDRETHTCCVHAEGIPVSERFIWHLCWGMS